MTYYFYCIEEFVGPEMPNSGIHKKKKETVPNTI